MVGGRGESGSVTLAFTIGAVEALASPAIVFADAREWCRHVGIVDDDRPAVEAAVSRYGIRQDYELGSVDGQSALSRLKWEADTDRYVYIGTNADAQSLAEYVNWEYLDIREAAEKAGWRLADDVGPLDRLRAFIPGW